MGILPSHTPKIFVGNSVNDVVCSAIRQIHSSGELRDSRNGPVKSIYRAEMVVNDPRSRYLNIPGRKSNIFQMIAETFWVMAGDNRISGFLDHFLPRAVNYSDDGVTWRGAYGPRLYAWDQLEDVVNAFETDGLDTRRAVLSIYQPHLDSKIALGTEYGLEQTKDIPCNNFLNFWVDGDKRFHMELFQRSGDVIWGAGSINPYEFTFLQECVYELVKARTGDHDLTLGTYCHRVTNLHFYPEIVGKQIEEILDKNQIFCWGPPYAREEMKIDLGAVTDTHSMRSFFSQIVTRLTQLIHLITRLEKIEQSDREFACRECMYDLSEHFECYGVPATHTNTIWSTVVVLISNLTQCGEYMGDVNDASPALFKCVEASSFRKFNLMKEV